MGQPITPETQKCLNNIISESPKPCFIFIMFVIYIIIRFFFDYYQK